MFSFYFTISTLKLYITMKNIKMIINLNLPNIESHCSNKKEGFVCTVSCVCSLFHLKLYM